MNKLNTVQNVRGNEENFKSFQESVQRFDNAITYIRRVASQANQGATPPDLEERIACLVK